MAGPGPSAGRAVGCCGRVGRGTGRAGDGAARAAQAPAEGDLVITEHEEYWRWPAGEQVILPIVSVQRVVDGVIVLWRDYWDLATLTAAAPRADFRVRKAGRD